MFSTFNALKPVKVIVIGDLMLDRYTSGSTGRVSPEAPVLVVHEKECKSLPGGAGNVALNLVSLGARVSLFSRIGKDEAGKEVKRLLCDGGIDVHGIYAQENYPTTVKHRVISSHHHLLRLDTEALDALSVELEKQVIAKIETETADAIAISDYGKGFLTKQLLQKVIELGNKRNIPVIVDPKGTDFIKYFGATMIKPNKKEAYEAVQRAQSFPIENVGKELLEMTGAQKILITRSDEGMSLFEKDKTLNFPVKVREVSDVTGAGDTVLATVTLGMANDLNMADVIALANIAGALAVETLGCARITLSNIAERLLAQNVVNKIFDEDHLYALEQVVQQRPVAHITLKKDEELSAEFLLDLQEKQKDSLIILHIQGRESDDPLIKLLSTLPFVDFIILKQNILEDLLQSAARSAP
ncbi:MAG: bifunctional ADP-heptose synthase [Simkaniaceae bacterium]|nr:bifunctional ADP-heptose synthase [Simkaniaceae bacterium]